MSYKTWNEYKEYRKRLGNEERVEIEEIETIAEILGEIINKRHSLGLSQRDLAKLCSLPQSSIGRIESLKTTPNMDTLIRIMKPLGLKLKVVED